MAVGAAAGGIHSLDFRRARRVRSAPVQAAEEAGVLAAAAWTVQMA